MSCRRAIRRLLLTGPEAARPGRARFYRSLQEVRRAADPGHPGPGLRHRREQRRSRCHVPQRRLHRDGEPGRTAGAFGARRADRQRPAAGASDHRQGVRRGHRAAHGFCHRAGGRFHPTNPPTGGQRHERGSQSDEQDDQGPDRRLGNRDRHGRPLPGILQLQAVFGRFHRIFGAEPNQQVSFVDAGMPGMLPVINAKCVEQAVRTRAGPEGQDQSALAVRPQELLLSRPAPGLSD